MVDLVLLPLICHFLGRLSLLLYLLSEFLLYCLFGRLVLRLFLRLDQLKDMLLKLQKLL